MNQSCCSPRRTGRTLTALTFLPVGLLSCPPGPFCYPSLLSRLASVATTGILELVRPDGMVSARSSRRRDRLPRTDGHRWCDLERPPARQPRGRHSKRLRHDGACILRLDGMEHIPVSVLVAFLTGSRLLVRRADGDRSCFCCGQVHQRARAHGTVRRWSSRRCLHRYRSWYDSFRTTSEEWL